MAEVSLALSIIAVILAVLALPSVFHMFWGGPHVTFSFSAPEINDVRYLQCELTNRPISNRFLKAIGVRRSAAEVVRVYFSIREQGTNRYVVHAVTPEIKTDAGVAARNVRLPPSPTAATFFVAYFDPVGTAFVAPYDDTDQEDRILPPGSYYCEIGVLIAEKHAATRHRFIIGRAQRDCYWQGPMDG